MQKDLSKKLESVDLHVHPTYRPLPIRTDVYLTQRFPKRSRNQLQVLFKEKRVLVNGKACNASHKLKGDERVSVLLPEDTEYIPPDAVALNLIHEEDQFMAINKAPGVMMHPAGRVLSGTLLNAIHHYFDQKGNPLRPGLLQRLDKHTSGLLLVAKSNAAHQNIQDQLVSHDLDKIYLALCHGTPDSEGVIEAPIAEVEHPFFKKMGVRDDGKSSKTRYCTLASWEHCSLLGIRLYTGRQHQIRVHLAHIGHPLCGDELYGGEGPFPRQALHSYFLRLKHPDHGKAIELNAPLPDDFVRELLRLGEPHSIDDNLDIDCSARPWNPHTWLHKIHKS
jgi:23S rRNA pseudouridine1911/1915/1917 synthase